MSDQATIVAVSNLQPAAFATALAESNIFPVVDATWGEALDAVARVQPAAVIVSASAGDMPTFQALAIGPWMLSNVALACVMPGPGWACSTICLKPGWSGSVSIPATYS